MQRLYIVGNGFDLAHDLPTKYWDYHQFLQSSSKNSDFCRRMENTYGLGENTEYWWKDFETNLGKGDSFETDFEIMGESAIDEMVTDEGEPMPDVEDTLRYHFEPYYEFMNKLNETVLQWIETIDVNQAKRIFKRVKAADSYFFTFNYTELLEEVYKVPEKQICHIHGSISEGTVEIGHGNLESIEKYREEAHEKEKIFDKNGAEISKGIYNFYKASFKDTKKIIAANEDIFNGYRGITEVYVYGHSLGEVDMPYFKEIKRHIVKNAAWYFYVLCKKEELKEKKAELLKKIECLHIKRQYIHIYTVDKFLI